MATLHQFFCGIVLLLIMKKNSIVRRKFAELFVGRVVIIEGGPDPIDPTPHKHATE